MTGKVEDEQLIQYINETIRRLERLAKRLEVWAEEKDDGLNTPAAPV